MYHKKQAATVAVNLDFLEQSMPNLVVRFDYFEDLTQGAALPCDTLGVLFVHLSSFPYLLCFFPCLR